MVNNETDLTGVRLGNTREKSSKGGAKAALASLKTVIDAQYANGSNPLQAPSLCCQAWIFRMLQEQRFKAATQAAFRVGRRRGSPGARAPRKA